MKQMKFFIPVFLVALFSSSATVNNRFPQLIKGTIIDKTTQSPIEKAYIYIVSGEEEALSTSNGSFEITTWQAFPLTIRINHDQYQNLSVVYKKADDRPIIKLEKKR